MQARWLLWGSLFVGCACVLFLGAASAQPAAVGDYIVVLKGEDAPERVAERHRRQYGADVAAVYKHALRGYAGRIPANALAKLRADPDVLFVSAEREFTMTADCGREDILLGAEQCVPFNVERIEGDASSTRSGDGVGSVPVNVAIVDTGIEASHPDLRVEGGVDCTKKVPRVEQPAIDSNGHGSHVAGIVGALDNGFGVVGIAPGARLWSARTLKKNGIGLDSSILCAIDWVTSTRSDADPTNDIQVANMSLGGKGSDDGNCGRSNRDPIHLAICNSVASGVAYVASAGNAERDLAQQVPGAYSEVLTATAVADSDGSPGGAGGATCIGSADDIFAFFSNFATQQRDQSHTVAAPGVCIWSTYTLNPDTGRARYALISGTSQASPHVAGTVALCIHSGACAGLTPAQIVAKIATDAAAYNAADTAYGFVGDPLRPESDRYFGYLVAARQY